MTLREQVANAETDEEARAFISRLAQISRAYRISTGIGIAPSPAEQAQELDPYFVVRPHVTYLSERLAQAVRDVERGQSRRLVVSMPPRSGKSTLSSLYSPLWLLRRHPEWKIVLAAHDGGLTAAWARTMRHYIEDRPDLGIALMRDGGAGSRWQTVEKGGMYATSVRGALTGRGARVMIIDDPVKDFVESHSLASRDTLWNWWLSVAQTRLEPPSLVLVVMTRWHEDDFVGRLLSKEYEGDPGEWEVISLPAFADTENDVLQRQPDEPLLSPLLVETPAEAAERWESVRRTVGSYTFAAMYQQRPAPARGAIFDSGWWRYWTTDPDRATDDRVVYLDPASMAGARWLDSWDCSFKGGVHATGGSWVVGQRWARSGPNRYLIAQVRKRFSFTETLAAMERWAEPDNPVVSPYGHLVHGRLVEDKANGPAIIDVMKQRISGLKPINPTSSKEARARAVTPEVESGHVYLPHPGDPGNEWVSDLLSELRNFPNDAYDDQVDALTQALHALRSISPGRASIPGRIQSTRPFVPRNIAAAARSDIGRRRP